VLACLKSAVLRPTSRMRDRIDRIASSSWLVLR
jgi:hypothetical protein